MAFDCWDVFWDRVARGVDVSQRDDFAHDAPESELVRYAIAQQEAAIPNGQAWNIEVLI